MIQRVYGRKWKEKRGASALEVSIIMLLWIIPLRCHVHEHEHSALSKFPISPLLFVICCFFVDTTLTIVSVGGYSGAVGKTFDVSTRISG